MVTEMNSLSPTHGKNHVDCRLGRAKPSMKRIMITVMKSCSTPQKMKEIHRVRGSVVERASGVITGAAGHPRWLQSLLVLIGVMFWQPVFATLTVHVDRDPVALNESFTLTLSSDRSVSGQPDFSVLERDFDIAGREQSQNFSMINGHVSRSIQWQLTLIPRHTGQVTIPPIPVGKEASPATTITVTAAAEDRNAAAGGSELFLEVKAEPADPYVQQQVLYTVRLYHALDSDSAIAEGSSLSAPSVQGHDAVIKPLGENHRFLTIRQGRRYEVIERRYAIFPQTSGELTIDPVLFDGRLSMSGGGGLFAFDPFQRRTRIKRIRSSAVTLHVKPVPAAFSGRDWLPASEIQLAEVWADKNQRAVVGEPITRTLRLKADGLTAAQLPPLAAQAPAGMKQYPDQPVRKDIPGSHGITGMREEKVALIPTRPGTLELPAVEMRWWNTRTDREEVARIPAETLQVVPAPANSVIPLPPAPVPSAPRAADQPAVTPSSCPPATVSVKDLSRSRVWPWLALVLGLGWLATALAWWWRSRRPERTVVENPARPGRRAALRALHRACQDNDPVSARDALLAWSATLWPDDPPSLTTLFRRADPRLAQAIAGLNRALYAKEGSPWSGEQLWQAVRDAGQAGEAPKSRSTESLPPLYKSWGSGP